MNNSASVHVSPTLPLVAQIPLAYLPMPMKTLVITSAMNMMFARPLQEGELDFLADRVMNVSVSDAKPGFSVTLDQGRLRAGKEQADADVTIEGTVYTFLLLAARREDADTLFFRRQLKTSGDTELGLHLKNFLDGLDPESVPFHRTIDFMLRSSITMANMTGTK